MDVNIYVHGSHIFTSTVHQRSEQIIILLDPGILFTFVAMSGTGDQGYDPSRQLRSNMIEADLFKILNVLDDFRGFLSS